MAPKQARREFYCSVCDITINEKSKQKHLDTDTHLIKAERITELVNQQQQPLNEYQQPIYDQQQYYQHQPVVYDQQTQYYQQPIYDQQTLTQNDIDFFSNGTVLPPQNQNESNQHILDLYNQPAPEPFTDTNY